MATNPNIILAAGQGRPQSVDYNSAQNLVDADVALKAKQDQQDRQQAMQAQSAFQSALRQSGGDYDRAIAQSEQQGYDMTPVRMARTKLQEEIYKTGQEQLNQHKIEDDLVGRIFNTMDATDPSSVQRGTAMLMRVDPQGGWDQIIGSNPTKESLAQLSGLGMTAKEHADLAQKSLESMKSGDWLGFLAAGKKSSNSPEDWQGITQVAQRLGIAPEMVAHVAQMTPDQLDAVITKGKQGDEKLQSPEVEAIKAWSREHGGAQPTQKDLEQIHRGFKEAGTIVRVSGGGQTGGDAKSIADAIISGDQPPDMKGLYRFTGPVRAELARRGYNLTKATEDWTGTQKYLSTLNGAQQTRLRQAVEFTRESLPIVQNLVTEWDSAGLPVLSKANLDAAASGAYGSKQQSLAVRLKGQIADLTSELGTVYKGGNSSTDESLKLAAQNLQGNWSKQAALDALKQIDTNLTIRANSIRNTGPIANEGNPYAPQTGGGVPGGVSSLLANKGPGIYTLTDGSKWRKDANGISKVQ